MQTCIICCKSNGGFNKPEHIVPQGLVKSNLILRGVVCDVCNSRFGGTLDSTLTSSLGKTAFYKEPKIIVKEINPQTHLNRNVLDSRAKKIMDSEEETAQKRGGQSSTAILTTGSHKTTGEHGLFRFDLEPNNLYVNFGKRYLFALAKIAAEYLFYESIHLNVNVRTDWVFQKTCSALNEFTVTEKICIDVATRAALKKYDISMAYANSNFKMPFKRNGVWWKEMSVGEYVNRVRELRGGFLEIWLQIINISNYVGVLIALGNIEPFIIIVGSGSLSYRFCNAFHGQTLSEFSKFK